MEPLAAAGYVLVGVALFAATLVGAVAGAIAWALKAPLVWIAPLAVAAYLAAARPLLSIRVGAALQLGTPLLILTLLASWLIAQLLEQRARWRSMWAALAAFAGAMMIGFVSARLFRVNVTYVALVADVFLVPYVWFVARRRTARPGSL